MSRFLNSKFKSLRPYVPGEQPLDKNYVKLNTNESPFPPSPKAEKAAIEAVSGFNLYSDPECRALKDAFSQVFGLDKCEVVFSNGSDEILTYALMAFGSAEKPVAFADITYGFYRAAADFNGLKTKIIPLKKDLSIDPRDYEGLNCPIIIANPNAPTGMVLPVTEIEKIIKGNPESVVIVDEAYIDFGGESCISLIKKYDNLLVVRTFSKSRSLAGARLGFAAGNRKLTEDLDILRNSSNPYNVNMAATAAGRAALLDREYFEQCVKKIIKNREYLCQRLSELEFEVLPSSANFVFAKKPGISGETVYRELKRKGVLVRHFTDERIKDYNRITVGSTDQIDILAEKLKEISEEHI